ncbi:MAG: hypothetical protein JXB45_02605 [Candidatus Krumholzibacteriota bacterium]|nr:hypothetical protein [Candidatus Krumholzibacteriota bacterium]
MREKIVVWSIISMVILAPGSLRAHHAMEYIDLESYNTARKGEFIFHLHYDYMVDDHNNPRSDHWELTPGISRGITNRLMFDIHTHFAKFGPDHVVEGKRPAYEPYGPSPFMEALAGNIQYRLTEGWVLDVALGAGFEIPFERSREVLGSEDNLFSGILIISKGFGQHGNFTFNLLHEHAGEMNGTVCALGMKVPLSDDPHGIAAGIEARGAVEDTGDDWSILPGIYMPLGARNVTLKSGIEYGKCEGHDSLRASITMMYQF